MGSGMGIVQVNPLSGYDFDTSDVLPMYEDQGLNKIERQGKSVIFYWTEVCIFILSI